MMITLISWDDYQSGFVWEFFDTNQILLTIFVNNLSGLGCLYFSEFQEIGDEFRLMQPLSLSNAKDRMMKIFLKL